MLEGLMQDFPLTVHHLLGRMRGPFADRRVATLTAGGVQALSFGAVAERVDRLARVLGHLGVQRGDRVGTLAWNTHRHLELYFAVPCSGAVLHTVNARLFPEQIAYIIAHAQDRVLFVDDALVEVLEPLAAGLSDVRQIVVMGDGDAGSLPGALRYEELLEEAGPGPFAYPELPERAAAALCYTSGTTGNPKGVLYSHRSVTLHSMSNGLADAMALGSDDRLLCVVPMFHVNAWGLPFAAAMLGAELVLPGRFTQADALAGLIESERPTVMNGVPTVWSDLLRHAEAHPVDLSGLRRGVSGGSAVPRGLMEAWQERHGVQILQAWGMTETSPICTVARPPAGAQGEEAWGYRSSQGRIQPWVELRLMGDDGVQPWDGESSGEIQVRGPWIASRYFEDPSGDDKFADGWLRTGDIGSVTPDGFVRISDRAKDLIKSGGEWISSVELEGELMGHPEVVEAAVIAKPDARWSERPLACVVLAPGARAGAEELRAHLDGRVARWWIPDEFAFVDEVPKTSVGKFDKKVLRARLADGTLAGRVPVSS